VTTHEPWNVEGERPAKRRLRDRLRARQPSRRSLWIAVGCLLVLNFVLASVIGRPSDPTSVPYSFFRDQVKAGNVSEVTSQSDTIEGTFSDAMRYPPSDGDEVTRFETQRPEFADDTLLKMLLAHDVTVDARDPDARPFWQTVLLGFGPTLLLVSLFVLVLRRAGGGMLGLGRSRARRYDGAGERITFADVAGIDEARDALVEVVDALRNPDRYRALGAAIPRGVLLSGPPGTGKTLLARAVAGEADVPFYSLSASEFVEMVAGVGASRVRDLFTRAKEAAPAIVFVDELDAIGRARGGRGFSTSPGNDEREQTLNQILTEMDGFTGSEGVVVLAATNRPEILDKALLRPGRFDRRVVVSPPDRVGRQQILEVHTRSVPLDDDVDLARVAATTPGMVGADLRNLVNEAALAAARHARERVSLTDFMEALEKIVLGAARRIALSPFERERTAFHEAGHALLGMLEPGADPVRKVSIVPRGQALGVTLQSPEDDRYGYDSHYLRGRIMGLLGGRAAEELVYADVTTGAEADLEQVTRIARQMVGRWGMSERVGLVSVLPAGEEDALAIPTVAEATRELVDNEVRRIVSEAYELALARLRDHRDQLEALAQALLERETLDEDDAYEAAGFAPHIADEVAPSEPEDATTTQ
jgi:cell division protease FtsH